jgi:2-octaprenyl-6-methoxyphenol hydroxylase
MLGAVLSYGHIVAPLQQAWVAAQQREPQRLHSRFGAPVAALKNLGGSVEVDAGIADRFDLAVVAEGGVFADHVHKAPGLGGREMGGAGQGNTTWGGRYRPDRPESPSSASPGTARPHCCR